MGPIFIIGLFLWGWVEISVFIFVSNEVGVTYLFRGVPNSYYWHSFPKKSGLSVLNRVRNDLAQGHPPVISIADSISLVIGGALLLIPGYVTDSVGLLLFIPGFGLWLECICYNGLLKNAVSLVL